MVAASLLAPVLYFAVFMLVAMSFQIIYPWSGFVTWGFVSAAVVVGAILLHRRGPRDWYLRGAAWGLVAVVLATCFFGYIVGQFVHVMKDF